MNAYITCKLIKKIAKLQVSCKIAELSAANGVLLDNELHNDMKVMLQKK